MAKSITIDFVSDMVCPWCIIGLQSLEKALVATSEIIDAKIRFHPFELNPGMSRDGQNIGELVTRKYGMTQEQSAASRETVKARAAAVGFTMAMSDKSRIYNTFDAHRLLHWAELEGRQVALKHALFSAYFTAGKNLADPVVLAEAAEKAGLDRSAARKILATGRYAEEVRRDGAFWRSRGINSIPSIVIDGRHLISGGQSPEAYEQALRELARQEP